MSLIQKYNSCYIFLKVICILLSHQKAFLLIFQLDSFADQFVQEGMDISRRLNFSQSYDSQNVSSQPLWSLNILKYHHILLDVLSLVLKGNGSQPLACTLPVLNISVTWTNITWIEGNLKLLKISIIAATKKVLLLEIFALKGCIIIVVLPT